MRKGSRTTATTTMSRTPTRIMTIFIGLLDESVV
jgi:hypothetical protein